MLVISKHYPKNIFREVKIKLYKKIFSIKRVREKKVCYRHLSRHNMTYIYIYYKIYRVATAMHSVVR